MRSQPPEDWPLVHASRMVRGPVHHWHVQILGDGPVLLMLHGAGGSTHSFRALMSMLSEKHTVLAVDLPGHGFTQLGAQRRSGLHAMAEDIGALCDALDMPPSAIIGHSAGAAIALQMARARPVKTVIGINPALSQFEGLAGVVFPAMAKMLAAVPFTAKLFSGTAARPERVRALIDGTGSVLDAEGLALYRRLVSDERHVNGALCMMAQWSLDDLLAHLPDIDIPVSFLVGDKDKTVPPKVAHNAAQHLPHATVQVIEGLGHLAHEEAPEQIYDFCLDALATA